jgi:hypothetical protein
MFYGGFHAALCGCQEFVPETAFCLLAPVSLLLSIGLRLLSPINVYIGQAGPRTTSAAGTLLYVGTNSIHRVIYRDEQDNKSQAHRL